MDNWEKDVLATLKAPATPANLRYLRTWQRWEGGHTNNSATWNWLNTTKGKQFPSINDVGVRAFPDYRTGVAYTADTIIGGYPSIVEGLRSGNPYSKAMRAAMIADLSKWVSGSRTARPDYGQRILGARVSTAPTVPAPRRLASVKTQPMSRSALSPDIIDILDDGDDFWDILRTIPGPEMAQPVSTPHPMTQPDQPVTGKGFAVPMSWQGTHVTDGLGWGTKTAHDFMLPAGTPVEVPESGTVKYFHPEGAQGGGSLVFVGDSGREYWFGHIANGAKAGTRLRKGQQFAVVADQNVSAPHLHADVR